MKNILAIIGILLSIAAVIPYWLEALKGKAKPNMVSWFTWTLLTLIASSAALADDNWQVGLAILANALGTGSIVMLGIWKGYAKMTRFDAICQIVAFLGLLSWPLLHTAMLAVIVTIIIDTTAALPTLRHAYKRPHEEAWAAYALAAAGSFCALLATSSYGFTAVVYPIWLVVADGSIAALTLWRSSRIVRSGA